MPQRKTWPSVLFLYHERRLSRIDHTRAFGFHIGIWWHNDTRLVAFLQSIAEIKEPGNLIDSELTHDSCWDMARMQLSCREETEYFDIPRGRIVWDTVHQSGVLYHGNATPPTVFRELARLFRLPRWDARLDVHYLTGEALEAFYSID